jgi:hypothetical protein
MGARAWNLSVQLGLDEPKRDGAKSSSPSSLGNKLRGLFGKKHFDP